MARALTKHVIKHDWFSELRELAGDRWAEVSDQAPTRFAIWVGGGTPQQCLHMVAARRAHGIMPRRPAQKPWLARSQFEFQQWVEAV